MVKFQHALTNPSLFITIVMGSSGVVMAELGQFALKLRFSGKSIEKHGLDLYDGATSFHGFSQAIQLAVHAYMNDEIVGRATAMKGAQVYFSSPRRGSVLFDIIVVIEKYPALFGFSAPIFYDFIKYAFKRATGSLNADPETPSVSKINKDNEPYFDELAETMEGALQRAHRSIDHGVKQVTLERPRSELVVFNKATSDWVHTRDENPEVETFTGNVTRYNSITGNARAYIRELKKIVPVRPDPSFMESKKGFLTWSLHGNTIATNKELEFEARRIDSARGDVKRLILTDCKQAAISQS
jgi:hypothetical protein